jgi:precorrin-6Y C5,15-methyltransferase (decarboxylating)
MQGILKAVLSKNPAARIVATCVTLETLQEIMQAAQELPVSEPQVRQIAVSRAQKVGGYHMMKALNPVYLIDFEGKG